MEPFMGRYFSTEYVRTKFLVSLKSRKRTDDQMEDDISRRS